MLLLLAAVAGWVRSGLGQSFDTHVLAAMRVADTGAPWGPWWLPSAARDVTSLGSAAVLIPLNLAVCTWLWLSRGRAPAATMAAAGLGAYVINSALKHLFGRVRPHAITHLVAVVSPSFPSGHATASCATYMAAALLFAGPQVPVIERRLVFVAALGTTFAVGCSRVYLGVHYPTDVIAGWVTGAGWALMCVTAAPVSDSRPAGVAGRHTGHDRSC